MTLVLLLSVALVLVLLLLPLLLVVAGVGLFAALMAGVIGVELLRGLPEPVFRELRQELEELRQELKDLPTEQRASTGESRRRALRGLGHFWEAGAGRTVGHRGHRVGCSVVTAAAGNPKPGSCRRWKPNGSAVPKSL
jgi:hypothetical protein